MHECVTCGLYCDCDGEDIDQPAPMRCTCSHEGSGLDTSGSPIYDDDFNEDCCHHGVSFDDECEECLEEEEDEDDGDAE